MPKAFLIDTTRCTACRGCQVGCKEWHNLPANHTYQVGTHQNPPDLNPYNYKLVRFNEHEKEDGTVIWNFFPDQCRHCITPICKEVGDMAIPNAITQDPVTGIVLFTEKTREFTPADAQAVTDACPYNIPRRDNITKQLTKCDMCVDRVLAGLKPVCVATCPTGCMVFDDREEILRVAQKRLEYAKKTWPDAHLCDVDEVNVIFLLAENKKYYYEFASFA